MSTLAGWISSDFSMVMICAVYAKEQNETGPLPFRSRVMSTKSNDRFHTLARCPLLYQVKQAN